MRKLTFNTKGFASMELLIAVAVVLVISVVGGLVYHSDHKAKTVATVGSTKSTQTSKSGSATSTTKESTATAEAQAKTAAMATWSSFSNNSLGLKFRYPSAWGQSTVTTMNSTPDTSVGTFYKISFANATTYITVNPKASLQDYSTTFASLKATTFTSASSGYVFINEANVVGDMVQDEGNQQATIYAARSVNLSNMNASDVILTDTRNYNSSCTQSSYTSCYTTDELQDYRWLLEDVDN